MSGQLIKIGLNASKVKAYNSQRFWRVMDNLNRHTAQEKSGRQEQACGDGHQIGLGRSAAVVQGGQRCPITFDTFSIFNMAYKEK